MFKLYEDYLGFEKKLHYKYLGVDTDMPKVRWHERTWIKKTWRGFLKEDWSSKHLEYFNPDLNEWIELHLEPAEKELLKH